MLKIPFIVMNLAIFFVVKIVLYGYNNSSLRCAITSVNFEPTFTFTGFLYRQAAVKPSPACRDWKGRLMFGCGYPPSVARSQKTEGGILGK